MEKKNVKEDAIDEKKTVDTPESTATASPAKPKFAKGVVSKCKKLYLREAPDKTSAEVAILDAGTELRVNISESSDDWYKVTTKNRKMGYCMKQYITING